MLSSTLTVHTTPSYPVTMVTGLFEGVGAWLNALPKSWDRIVVVTDSNVGPLYANQLLEALATENLHACVYTFPAGEGSKNPVELVNLLEWMARENLTRQSLVVALGGGVVCDLAGCAASLFMRGIDCVMMPTTLLAMVDASVGGKTAVNLTAGKNLMGTFHQPRGVYMAMGTLSTLDREAWQNGWAEIIKTAMIGETRLWSVLDNLPNFTCEALPSLSQDAMLTVLKYAVAFKRDVVEDDEKESGRRAILNFGHTVGHSIELASHYTMGHGQAVAMGMVGVTQYQVKRGVLDKSVFTRLVTWLHKVGLPLRTSYDIATLEKGLWHDKKRCGDTITFIVPTALGVVERVKLDKPAIEELLMKGFL